MQPMQRQSMTHWNNRKNSVSHKFEHHVFVAEIIWQPTPTNNTGLLLGRGKKSQILWVFRDKFAGISENFWGQFCWKTIGKEWPILWELPEQILLKAIGFALTWGKFSMKLDALIVFI